MQFPLKDWPTVHAGAKSKLGSEKRYDTRKALLFIKIIDKGAIAFDKNFLPVLFSNVDGRLFAPIREPTLL